jgi:hypothetical protein
MNLNDYIMSLQNPDTNTANFLTSRMNAASASEQGNLANYGASQGWGGRSGTLGKLQAGVANDVTGQLQEGLLGAEQMRVSNLGNAVMMQAQIDAQAKQAKLALLSKLFEGLGMGGGLLLGGGLLGGGAKAIGTPTN